MRQQQGLGPGAEPVEPSLPAATSPSNGDDKEPDGGYGWVCVICQLLITACTWGVKRGTLIPFVFLRESMVVSEADTNHSPTQSFGVYLSHYLSTDLFPGTSQASYAFIGGLSQSQITLIAPLVTHSTKVLGTKSTLFIGVLLETGALVAASFATQAWHLYLTQGLLFGWGCSFLYIGTIGIIPQWFHRQRGMANGVAAAGSGIGGLIFSLASDAMITNLGVAWSFRITAVCAAVTDCAQPERF
ncbi:hypothetical protein NQ176_g3289 [Zarea fungicola]|uniref:Uncharacterized protein n=1 Tax=Zarea fungicola TaxID=93591 RepID=A0ACC1NKE1_9HYPO|nr:hypothetical protein NQ176_g3289 [Lecanicillium fungicola]